MITSGGNNIVIQAKLQWYIERAQIDSGDAMPSAKSHATKRDKKGQMMY